MQWWGRTQLLGLAILAPIAAWAGDRPAVAVFDISVREVPGFGAKMAKFREILEAEIAAAGFQTVPRADLEQRLLDEKKKSYAECVDEACQIELGKAVSAQKVVSASWSAIGSECVLTLRLYDLKSELAEFTSKSVASCDEPGLSSAIQAVGFRLRARTEPGYASFQFDLQSSATIRNPPTDEKGYLSIKAKAEAQGRRAVGIDVWLNGEMAGAIPPSGTFVKELPVGRYVLLLRPSGGLFGHEKREFELTPEGLRIPSGTGVLQLRPLFGTLQIRAKAPGAVVQIDGRPVPLRDGELIEDVPLGAHEVMVEAPGYLPSSPEEILIQPGESVLRDYQLERNAGGLVVAGEPPGASVLLDDARVGDVPLMLSEVDVGDRVLEIRALGHHPQRQLITISRGTTQTVNVRLVRKIGRLKVEATAVVNGLHTPVEADLYLDDRRVGVTPWKGEVLAEVEHVVAVRLGAASSTSMRVRVEEGGEELAEVGVPAEWAGATASVSFDLVPGPWRILSGMGELRPDQPNALHPGPTSIELFLDDKPVGRGMINTGPGEEHLVRVIDRPLTEEELSYVRGAWMLRKWFSTALGISAGTVSGVGLLLAHRAESERNDAIARLRFASLPEEVAGYRQSAVDQENARSTAESVALGALFVASAAGVWALAEWLILEPGAGSLSLSGLELVTMGDDK